MSRKKAPSIDNIVAVAIIIAVIPICFLCVRLFLTKSFSSEWSLGSDPDKIATAIAGLTAPVIGMATTLLLYISFRQQFKANFIQLEAIRRQDSSANFNTSYQIIKDFENDVNAFTIANPLSEDYNVEIVMVDEFPDSVSGYFNKVRFFFDKFEIILDKVESTQYNPNDYELIYSLVFYLHDHYFSLMHNRLDVYREIVGYHDSSRKKLTDELEKLSAAFDSLTAKVDSLEKDE